MTDTFASPSAFRIADCEERLREQAFVNPSLFGRLVAIACLREECQDASNAAWTGRLVVAEVDQIIRKLHLEVFVAWLGLTLRQQEADLKIYLATGGIEMGPSQALPRIGRRLTPPDALAAEADLFAMDLSLVAPKLAADLRRMPD